MIYRIKNAIPDKEYLPEEEHLSDKEGLPDEECFLDEDRMLLPGITKENSGIKKGGPVGYDLPTI